MAPQIRLRERSRLASAARGSEARDESLMIQRDGPLTLQTPSLLQQPDPAARYRLPGDQRLHLDPDILALIQRHIDQQLDPARLRPALQTVNLNLPAQPAGGGAPTNPLVGPATPAAAPLAPRGEGPDKARAAELSDLRDAILAVPAIDQGITNLRSQASERVAHDWSKLNTGEKIGVVSTVALIAGGTLAGIASNRDSRQWALSQLNDRLIPVPGVDWLHLEVNTGANNVMVGMHVDVGALLPPSLGFGPGDPNAMGGPPEAAMPGQRSERSGTNPGTIPAAPSPQRTGLADRIRSSAGQGASLGAPTRQALETGLGTSLSAVRVHTGGEADLLARALDADAFTTGHDIFFRAGTFDPRSHEGVRLLTHEVIHTMQQAAGPVGGTPVPGGVLLSHPSDPCEQAARRGADSFSATRFGHHIGRIRIYQE